MKFLVVGSGAREHIIAKKLKDSGARVYSILTNKNPDEFCLSFTLKNNCDFLS